MTDISVEVRNQVRERDGGCIFCQVDNMGFPRTMNQIMHYIPRSRSGLGIPENLAEGCPYHHTLLDQSPERGRMMEYFREYLKEQYEDWDERKLVYKNRWEV